MSHRHLVLLGLVESWALDLQVLSSRNHHRVHRLLACRHEETGNSPVSCCGSESSLLGFFMSVITKSRVDGYRKRLVQLQRGCNHISISPICRMSFTFTAGRRLSRGGCSEVVRHTHNVQLSSSVRQQAEPGLRSTFKMTVNIFDQIPKTCEPLGSLLLYDHTHTHSYQLSL